MGQVVTEPRASGVGDTSTPASADRRDRARPAAPEWGRLAMLLGAGLALRLLFLPLSYEPDLDVLRGWAVRLVTLPLSSFYDTTGLVDHLPGDLWLLWGLAHLYRLASPDLRVQDPAFMLLLKLVPALADVATGT